MKPDQTDDVTTAVSLSRHGMRQKDRKEHTDPWDGPNVIDPNANPKGIVMHWAKTSGSSGGTAVAAASDGPPDVATESVHHQFGNLAKTSVSEGKVGHSVGALDAAGEIKDATLAAMTTILGDSITHQMTSASVTTMLKDKIKNMVGASFSSVEPGSITHSSSNVEMLASAMAVVDALATHFHGSPIMAMATTLHGGSHSAPADRRRGFSGPLTLAAPITTLSVIDGVTVAGTAPWSITEDATLGWHSAGNLLREGPGTYQFSFDFKFIGPSPRVLQWWWSDADNWANDAYVLVLDPDGSFSESNFGLGVDFFTAIDEFGVSSVTVVPSIVNTGFLTAQFEVRIATGNYTNMQFAFELDLNATRGQYQGLNDGSGVQIKNYTIERLADRTFMSAAVSAPTPPSDPVNYIPNNGMRWIDTTIWRVGHPFASKRQVFGWQAKRNAAVIGAG